MGLLSHGIESLSLSSRSRRASYVPTNDGAGEPDGREADTSTLDKDEGNILMALISQLRPGMDLSKIALPTFVLEPRSLLERVTDFFSHPDLIFGVEGLDDPKDRFMKVMAFYLSGWHIKPRGVKKPYNPVLNEFFRCAYHYDDGSKGYYVAEQVSHHPPISAFFYVAPQKGLFITGELKPKSKFLGNSAATIMEGEDRIRLLHRPEDGEYQISMPNTYARGILFGKMILELGDLSTIRNDTTGYTCEVDFKTKGWISGGYNMIAGSVKGPNRSEAGSISGMWSGAIEYSDKKGKKSCLFDAAECHQAPKSVLPESEQEEYESRRLWSDLTKAIKISDMTGAQEAKSAVEEHQRDLRAQREAAGEPAPKPRFFQPVGEKWMPLIDPDNLPKNVDELEALVQKFIFGDRIPGPSTAGSGTPTSSTPATAGIAPAAATSPSPVRTAAPMGAAGAAGAGAAVATSPTEPPNTHTSPGPPIPGPHFDAPPPQAQPQQQ